ncbi:DsbA family protein [Bergeriella denitrificans]|uniref:DSBA-like thioredoxin domain n=1 Tax=Bergeriella denitrificans TaxID=494 RepID=A0A378UKG6_BERDE|nr:DsbA family protein [Bergeriella denitrificans]STZ76972.1 DSBA-like thioredoxin domain [Bergeriella denitrificans]
MQNIIYLYDPLCGWCYGASAGLAKLAADPQNHIRLQATGLFSRSNRVMDAEFAGYAWANDQRIAQLTGLEFSEAYRRHVLETPGAFDSWYLVQGMTAVAQTAPERQLEMLEKFQTARYVDGRQNAGKDTVAAILTENGLAEAAALLDTPDLTAAAEREIQAGQALMRQHGLRGVPGLLVRETDGGTWRVEDSGVLFA